MSEPLLLRDATVQEIQLELLRRTRFNELDGSRVAASLLKHRELWLAAILDRQGLADSSQPARLPMMGLIKLRDMPGNFWNADTLFVLTKTPEQARQLAQIAKDEEWAADEVYVTEDQGEIDGSLGIGGTRAHGLLQVWWD